MAKNDFIDIRCFGHDIGRLGLDENQNKSYFQFHPSYLDNNLFPNLFPATGIIKRIAQPQVFSKYNNDTFKGLPPMIADSLPDMFGNIIFKEWLATSNLSFSQISVIEQLAYVADRGMGALEYHPNRSLASSSTIDITEITAVLKAVLDAKTNATSPTLNHEALLNIFKMGTSAGGARPKILISENKQTGEITPGDINHGADFNHYLVKLSINDTLDYAPEVVEYSYYKTAIHLGINMMPSKLIDDKHFATLRFDRLDGKKQHQLTATGLTGWDFKDATHSSYANLFELALFLKVPHTDIAELFKRMVFNVVYCNTDDHFKNHTFVYKENKDAWRLSPAYDLTYAINPLINYKRVNRALSINGKRIQIKLADVLTLADTYTIKNPQKVIQEVQQSTSYWRDIALELQLPPQIINNIYNDFKQLE